MAGALLSWFLSSAHASEFYPSERICEVADDAQFSAYLGGTHPQWAGPRDGDRVVLLDGIYAEPRVFQREPRAGKHWLIVAANPQRAIVTGLWRVAGARTQLWGLKFQGQRLGDLGGVENRVTRCEFTGWGAPNAISVTAGRGAAIEFCWFHHPAPWTEAELAKARNEARLGIRVVGRSDAEVHTDLLIRRNRFEGFLDRPVHSRYSSGQTDFIEIGASQQYYTTAIAPRIMIEGNLFDGNPEGSGVVDIKLSGVTLRGNHLRNCPGGSMDLRAGGKSRIESNWFESSTAGVKVHGADHAILGNVFLADGKAKAKLMLCLGAYRADELGPNFIATCARVRCIGNRGTLAIGEHKGAPGKLRPVEATHVAAHEGEVLTQHEYAGAWDTPTVGAQESGTTYKAQASEPYELARPVTEAGVNATWRERG